MQTICMFLGIYFSVFRFSNSIITYWRVNFQIYDRWTYFYIWLKAINIITKVVNPIGPTKVANMLIAVIFHIPHPHNRPSCGSKPIRAKIKMRAMLLSKSFMMTSSNGNIIRVIGHLCGEFTGPRWIPRTKASDAEFWRSPWSASESTVE